MDKEDTDGKNRILKDFQDYCTYGSVNTSSWDTCITLDDVLGYDTTKDMMKEYIALPFLFPALFKRPIDAMLIYGPPGCGKTWITRATVASAKCPMITVHCYSLLARTMKSQTTFIKAVFQWARDHLPCILLLEDIEIISESQCREALDEFYNQIFSDQAPRVPILASTLKPWCVDLFTRRQFPKKLYIGLPEEKDRLLIIQTTLKDYKLTRKEIEEIASQTDGFSVSDLISFMKDAMMEPIRKLLKCKHFKKINGPLPSDPDTIVDDMFSICDEDDPDAQQVDVTNIPQEKLVVPVLEMVDVTNALKKAKPTVTESEIQQYEEIRKLYQ